MRIRRKGRTRRNNGERKEIQDEDPGQVLEGFQWEEGKEEDLPGLETEKECGEGERKSKGGRDESLLGRGSTYKPDTAAHAKFLRGRPPALLKSELRAKLRASGPPALIRVAPGG